MIIMTLTWYEAFVGRSVAGTGLGGERLGLRVNQGNNDGDGNKNCDGNNDWDGNLVVGSCECVDIDGDKYESSPVVGRDEGASSSWGEERGNW